MNYICGIEKLITEGKYNKALEIMNDYLNNEKNGIFDNLLYDYIICLIFLSKEEEALRYLDKLNKLFPNFYKTNIAYCCLLLGKKDKIKEILNDSNLCDEAIYAIAYKCYLCEEYELCKLFIEKGLKSAKDEYKIDKYKKCLIHIESLKENNKNLKLDYQYFKKRSGKLVPGDTVYLKLDDKHLDIYNYKRIRVHI